jgi:hypothetical protein
LVILVSIFNNWNMQGTHHDRYYEGGISSVYLWEPEHGKGFVACFLVTKGMSSSWSLLTFAAVEKHS